MGKRLLTLQQRDIKNWRKIFLRQCKFILTYFPLTAKTTSKIQSDLGIIKQQGNNKIKKRLITKVVRTCTNLVQKDKKKKSKKKKSYSTQAIARQKHKDSCSTQAIARQKHKDSYSTQAITRQLIKKTFYTNSNKKNLKEFSNFTRTLRKDFLTQLIKWYKKKYKSKSKSIMKSRLYYMFLHYDYLRYEIKIAKQFCKLILKLKSTFKKGNSYTIKVLYDSNGIRQIIQQIADEIKQKKGLKIEKIKQIYKNYYKIILKKYCKYDKTIKQFIQEHSINEFIQFNEQREIHQNIQIYNQSNQINFLEQNSLSFINAVGIQKNEEDSPNLLSIYLAPITNLFNQYEYFGYGS